MDAGITILTGPTKGTLVSCGRVCGDAGMECALNQWDFRDPSHGVLQYESCSFLASCEEVPTQSVSCFGTDEVLMKQSCACR